MRRGAVALATFALCGASVPGVARADAHAARVEAGAEWDSNPRRLETIAGDPGERKTPSAALRLAATAELDVAFAERFSLQLGGGAAVRRLLAPEAQGEDLLVDEARAALHVRLGTAWLLGLHGGYYDVVQRANSIEDARDFRSITPGLRLLGALGAGRVHAGAGWRWFRFKPAAVLDFAGPTATLGYRRNPVFTLDGAAEWEWGVGASAEQRHFAAQPCADPAVCGAGVPARRDHFVTFDADVTRTGDNLVGAGLALQTNQSDRFGESLFRLVAHLRGVFLLPWELALTTRAELVLTRYADQIPVGTAIAFTTIEEEGRSNLRVDLARGIGANLEAGVRYTFYTHTPGTAPIHFARHLAFGYLAATFGR